MSFGVEFTTEPCPFKSGNHVETFMCVCVHKFIFHRSCRPMTAYIYIYICFPFRDVAYVMFCSLKACVRCLSFWIGWRHRPQHIPPTPEVRNVGRTIRVCNRIHPLCGWDMRPPRVVGSRLVVVATADRTDFASTCLISSLFFLKT